MHQHMQSSSTCRAVANCMQTANRALQLAPVQPLRGAARTAEALTSVPSAITSPCLHRQPPLTSSRHRPWHSSSWHQQRSSIRCYSSPIPNPGNTPGTHPSIRWLCEVQSWPSQSALWNSSSTNSNGSSNGNGNGNGAVAHTASLQECESVDPASLPSTQFDAIIVLAGGLLPNGGLPEWAQRRLDVGRDLHMLLGHKPPILCSGGGTPHKPAVLGPSGHVLHESTSMANYLMDSGVEAAAVLKETASFDTVGNTYMSLAIHALPAGWRNIAVVTSHFHMPRSRALFTDIYRMAGSSLFGDPCRFKLTFLSASDVGVFDDYVYKARIEKEAGSVRHWQGVASSLHSLADVHAWLHADHLCYAVPKQHEFGKRTIKDQKLLESY